MDEPKVVNSPTVFSAGGPIYQITLPSGMIVTSPAGFGPAPERPLPPVVIVTESGHVLVRTPPTARPAVQP